MQRGKCDRSIFTDFVTPYLAPKEKSTSGVGWGVKQMVSSKVGEKCDKCLVDFFHVFQWFLGQFGPLYSPSPTRTVEVLLGVSVFFTTTFCTITVRFSKTDFEPNF